MKHLLVTDLLYYLFIYLNKPEPLFEQNPIVTFATSYCLFHQDFATPIQNKNKKEIYNYNLVSTIQ